MSLHTKSYVRHDNAIRLGRNDRNLLSVLTMYCDASVASSVLLLSFVSTASVTTAPVQQRYTRVHNIRETCCSAALFLWGWMPHV